MNQVNLTAPLVHDVQAARRILHDMESSGHLHGAFRRPVELSIFTAHNYAEPPVFERSLRHLGISDYTAIVRPVTVWSNSLRIRWFLDYLRNACTTPLVLYCDADDVVLRDDPGRIIRAFEEADCDILYCSTRWPRGYRCVPEIRKWADRIHPGRYLNGGAFVGRRETAIEVYEAVAQYVSDADTKNNPDSAAFYRNELAYRDQFPFGVGCDQAILRYLEPAFFPRLKVDAESRVFWRNDNRTPWQKLIRAVKRTIPSTIKQPIKRLWR